MKEEAVSKVTDSTATRQVVESSALLWGLRSLRKNDRRKAMIATVIQRK